jgi:hypothetical protein
MFQPLFLRDVGLEFLMDPLAFFVELFLFEYLVLVDLLFEVVVLVDLEEMDFSVDVDLEVLVFVYMFFQYFEHLAGEIIVFALVEQGEVIVISETYVSVVEGIGY